MPSLLLAMLGGAVGSGARLLFGKLTLSLFGPNYPWGTLGVNLIGGLLMGLLAGTLVRTGGSEHVRVLLGVGVLGGFTTFSAFSLDAMNMITRGDWGLAIGYALVSVIGSIGAVALGLAAVRSFA